MLKKILIALAAIVLIFVVVVALQPSEFQMDRSTKIAAPQADVPQMGGLVAMGEARPGSQSELRRAP